MNKKEDVAKSGPNIELKVFLQYLLISYSIFVFRLVFWEWPILSAVHKTRNESWFSQLSHKKSSTSNMRQLEKYVKYFYMLFQKQIFVRNLSKLNTFLSFG